MSTARQAGEAIECKPRDAPTVEGGPKNNKTPYRQPPVATLGDAKPTKIFMSGFDGRRTCGRHSRASMPAAPKSRHKLEGKK